MGLRPEEVPLYADAAVRGTHVTCGIKLDYTLGSLEQVGTLIDRLRAEGSKLADVSATLLTYGCYVGTVLVRNFGAVWRMGPDVAPPIYEADQLVLELASGIVLDPIGKVFRRFNDGEQDGLVLYAATVGHLADGQASSRAVETDVKSSRRPRGPIAWAVWRRGLSAEARLEAVRYVEQVSADLDALNNEIAQRRARIENPDESGPYAPCTSVRIFADAYIVALEELAELIRSMTQRGKTWHDDEDDDDNKG